MHNQFNYENREEIEWTNTWIDSAPEINKEKILIIGDSLIREIRSKLQSLLNTSIDYIGTSTIYEDCDFYNIFDSFFKNNVYKYSTIILNLGAHGQYLDTVSNKNHKDRFKKISEKFINYLQKICPNIVILYITPQVLENDITVYNEEVNNEICSRNKIYQEIADKYNLKTLDIFKYMTENKEYFPYSDFVHFGSEDAKNRFAAFVAGSLNKWTNKDNTTASDIEIFKNPGKQKLLFVGHSFHDKTKSSQFIQDLLKEKYQVTKFNFDPLCDIMDKFQILNNQEFDVVVLWQIMPSINKLKEVISYKRIAFFPMYGGSTSITDKRWQEYKDCNIINFSKTLHKKCKKCGLSSYHIQYFPKPKEIKDFGDEKSVFFWQRINEITPDTVDKVIGFKNLNKFYHHKAIDPGHQITEVSNEYKNKVEVSTWFDSKEEMENHLQKSAIYFAPRHFEGIGMSFLDAMAMGRCVIAANYPTMNEYIKNGVNGYLYKLKRPKKISIKNIKKIQKNTVKYIENGYQKWEKNKYKILDWIVSNVESNRNNKLIEKNLTPCETQKKKLKISITYLEKKITQMHIIYYLLGFLPIYKKRI